MEGAGENEEEGEGKVQKLEEVVRAFSDYWEAVECQWEGDGEGYYSEEIDEAEPAVRQSFEM